DPGGLSARRGEVRQPRQRAASQDRAFLVPRHSAAAAAACEHARDRSQALAELHQRGVRAYIRPPDRIARDPGRISRASGESLIPPPAPTDLPVWPVLAPAREAPITLRPPPPTLSSRHQNRGVVRGGRSGAPAAGRLSPRSAVVLP